LRSEGGLAKDFRGLSQHLFWCPRRIGAVLKDLPSIRPPSVDYQLEATLPQYLNRTEWVLANDAAERRLPHLMFFVRSGQAAASGTGLERSPIIGVNGSPD
jgi:hypothetical protein